MKDSGTYVLIGALLFALISMIFEDHLTYKLASTVIIFVALGGHAYITHNKKNK